MSACPQRGMTAATAGGQPERLLLPTRHARQEPGACMGLSGPHWARQIRTFTTPAVVHNYPSPPDRSDGRTFDHHMRGERRDARTELPLCGSRGDRLHRPMPGGRSR